MKSTLNNFSLDSTANADKSIYDYEAESFAGDALAEAFRRRPAKAWVQVAMAAIVQC